MFSFSYMCVSPEGITSGCYSPCRVLCWLVRHLISQSHCTQKTASPHTPLPGQASASFHLKNVFFFFFLLCSAKQPGRVGVYKDVVSWRERNAQPYRT